jgi:hypothetical protein
VIDRDPPEQPDTGAPPLPEEYLWWNRVLTEHCLTNSEAGVVYLAATPGSLAAAGAAGGQPLTAVQAQEGFSDAVRLLYRTQVLPLPLHLRLLRRRGPDGVPACTAFLAASVLAAYEMRTDETASAKAYYRRLSELLQCGMDGTYPRGFQPKEFEALWYFLRSWLERAHLRELALPGSDAGRRFLSLPLKHVLLRQVDIQRLPDFFDWAGYAPGQAVPAAAVEADLARWNRASAGLTGAGAEALADTRRPAVIDQVRQELLVWTGKPADAAAVRRTGAIALLLDFRQRQPDLSYIARRPAGFPATFDDGVRQFESDEEGWYDPVPVPHEDGPALLSGLAWSMHAGAKEFVLRRAGQAAIPLAPSPDAAYTGFLSRNDLVAGVPCAVLCHESLAAAAAAYLSVLCSRRCEPQQHPRLPIGWRLFRDVKVMHRHAAVPAGLESLSVASTTQVIPVGGLRIGRGMSWLAGAPPRLFITGLNGSQTPTLNGESAPLTAEGFLDDGGRLARPGEYEVAEGGRALARLQIVAPEADPFRARRLLPPEEALRRYIALPRGDWTVLGPAPGDVVHPGADGSQGLLAACPFEAVWAVASGPRAGARVLCLSPSPPPPQLTPRPRPDRRAGRSVLDWVSVIYNASVRRPLLEALCDAEDAALAACWRAYVDAARGIKRRLRRGRA